MRCSGAEDLLSGFPRNEASMGAEFRGKNRLIKFSAPEPSFYMCVGSPSCMPCSLSLLLRESDRYFENIAFTSLKLPN